jgi:hypothetical protein
MMRELSIYSVVIISIIITVIYIRQLLLRKIKPALAMWIFFSIAIIISMITYLREGNYGILDNIMNATDLVYVVSVTVAIIIFGDKSSRFTRFDTGCLIAVILITVFWFFTKDHLATNLLMQTILVIAYFPVINRLLRSKENTEPFLVWIGMLVAPVLALISSRGLLAAIYSTRAIICVSILLALMLRVEILNKRRN